MGFSIAQHLRVVFLDYRDSDQRHQGLLLGVEAESNRGLVLDEKGGLVWIEIQHIEVAIHFDESQNDWLDDFPSRHDVMGLGAEDWRILEAIEEDRDRRIERDADPDGSPSDEGE
jgi:hypothetical protein